MIDERSEHTDPAEALDELAGLPSRVDRLRGLLANAAALGLSGRRAVAETACGQPETAVPAERTARAE